VCVLYRSCAGRWRRWTAIVSCRSCATTSSWRRRRPRARPFCSTSTAPPSRTPSSTPATTLYDQPGSRRRQFNRAIVDSRLRPSGAARIPINSTEHWLSDVRRPGELQRNMTPSTKPDVDNLSRNCVRGGPSHGRRQRADSLAKIGFVVFKICEQTKTQTDRQTNILITILRIPPEGEAK